MFATVTALILTVTPQGAERLADLEHLPAAEFDRVLDSASRRKLATRVASPTVKIKLGETGEFSSGARIPYVPETGPDRSTRFTDAELRMLLTPSVSQEDLSLDFDFHWSRPDFSVLAGGEPSIQMVEAKARIALADGWAVVRTDIHTPPFDLLRRPSVKATEALWLLFRGSLLSE